MVDKFKASGELVTALFQAIEHGQNRIASVPGLLKQVIKEDAWRQYALPHSTVIHSYQSFQEFVDDWLHISIDDLKAICTTRADYEALDLIDKATTAPKHVHRDNTDNNNVIISKTTQGNSNTYALRKLRDDRPDLHREVLAGKLSPNAAMIQAGFRQKQITVVLDPARFANAINRHFNEKQKEQIIALVKGE